MTALPAVIQTFLTAHADRDADTAVRSFSPDAVVVDDGRTYRGTAELLDFLRRGGSEFTYTTTLTGVRRADADWIATHHLAGNFPGGVVDLDYRFTLRDELIVSLTIAP